MSVLHGEDGGRCGETVVRLYVLMNKFGCLTTHLNIIKYARETRKVISKTASFNSKGDPIKWAGNFLVTHLGVKYLSIVLMTLIAAVFIS